MDAEERDRRIQTVCLLVLTAIAIGGALFWLRPVMIPFVLSAFFASSLSPLIAFLIRRFRLPRSAAVGLTLLLGFLLLAALASLVSASVGQLAANRVAYQAQATALIAQVTEALPLDRIGIDTDALTGRLRDASVSAIGGMLAGTTSAILDLFSKSILVLIFLVFLLVGGEVALPAKDRPESTWTTITGQVERYVLMKALLSGATGFLVGVILWGFGVDLALVFGLFAFLLNFIPSIGSIIATLLPLPIVVMSPDISFATAVAAIAIPGVLQFGIGNVLEPRLMGSSLDLHPVTVLLTLMFWGALWGIVGMLLAVPMTAMSKLFFEKSELTRPVAELMAGRLDALRPG
ncbi:MAG: AI-2E family transporter [Myxococcota bacterium]